MYAHRSEHSRFDVVDLDPYGTAAPFIDAAVQSIRDAGELDRVPSVQAMLPNTNRAI